MNKSLKTILFVIFGFIVVGAIVFYIFFYKATITISSDPQTAQIEIAGYSQIGASQLRLDPGSYKLKISLPGYLAYEKDINLKIAQKINYNIQLKALPEAFKLVDYPAKFSTFSDDEQAIVYISNAGKTAYIVNNLDSPNKEKPSAITPEIFSDLQQLIWHPDKRLAILKEGTSTYLYDFGRYDLLNQEKKLLGNDIGDVAFDDSGGKVIYYYTPASGEKSLMRAKKDFSGPERLVDLKQYNLQNPIIRWSADSKYVLLISDQVLLVDMYTKNVSQLTQFISVSDADFTPDSNQIIYEVDNKLYLTDLEGQNKIDLNISTTLKKTAWLDDDHLLYSFRNSGIDATDNLGSLSIKDNTIINYTYNSSEEIDFSNLLVSDDKSTVYFESKGYLFRLALVDSNY